MDGVDDIIVKGPSELRGMDGVDDIIVKGPAGVPGVVLSGADEYVDQVPPT
jgi:hypothetical protein